MSIAEVETPSSGPSQGIIATMGGRFGGWALDADRWQADVRLRLVEPGSPQVEGVGADKLSPGKHTLRVDFKYDGGGVGKGGDRHALRRTASN